MVWKRDRKSKRSWPNQKVYTEKLLEKYGMDSSKSISMPMEPDHRHSADSGGDEDFENVKLYQSVIGSLIYLSIVTRPDITFAVNLASKYMPKPGKSHWSMVKGIMRYLRGTSSHGIQFGTSSDLIGYADADWGMDVETRRSMTGFVFMIGGPISWNSKLQKVVALSTVEAEYYSLVDEVQEGTWIISLIDEIGFGVKRPVLLKEDNQGCIAVAKNPGSHYRT
jgi:hypothetical protein